MIDFAPYIELFFDWMAAQQWMLVIGCSFFFFSLGLLIGASFRSGPEIVYRHDQPDDTLRKVNRNRY